MKKFALPILMLICLITLVACAGQTNDTPTETDVQTETLLDETTTEILTTQESTTPAETTYENKFDQWYNEIESGEWPDACSINFDGLKDISVKVDEVYEVPYIGFTLNADRYQAKYQQGREYYQIDVVVDDPDILKVVNIDKDKLMDYDAGGGLTLKGLAQGETTITLTMTYLPTGGTHSTSKVITVVFDTETT